MERMKQNIKYVSIGMYKQLEEENKRLQSSLDYANRDREDMHNKIIELGNKRESQRNMNYKLRKENRKLKEILNRIKELYEDEEEAELLNYLDEILDEILD